LGKSGQVAKWNKGLGNAVAEIPNIDPKNKCEIDTKMIEKLKEARKAIFPNLIPSWSKEK
jgi:hypothetical protein